jgi:hypothetical protein
MLAVAMLIVILNFLDGIFTYYAVSSGIATEANPLMAYLLSFDATAFFVVKHLLVSMGIYLLLVNCHKKSARIALWSIAALFIAINVYHIVQLSRYT